MKKNPPLTNHILFVLMCVRTMRQPGTLTFKPQSHQTQFNSGHTEIELQLKSFVAVPLNKAEHSFNSDPL